MLLLDLSNFFN